MKTLQIELPEKLAEELEALVREGWFRSEGEAIQFALKEFLNRRCLQLIERFQREDIAWALKQREEG